MKLILILLVLLAAIPAMADCEASLQSGTHSALDQAAAIAGAQEEAKDSCYPGQAESLDNECSTSINAQGKTVHHCSHTVTCNICDDDLRRKYEALD